MPAISCTAADLAAASKCLCGIASPADRQRVMIYLLQHIAGLDNLTPTELVARAKCLCGIPENRLKAVEVALLCAATGGVPPCPPCPPGGNCTYQDMQVAWTPTNLKLGEMIGFLNFGDLAGITTIQFLGATSQTGFDIEDTTTVTEIDWPNLVSIDPAGTQFGYFSVTFNPSIVKISAPKFQILGNGQFTVTNNPLMTSADFSSLVTVGKSVTFSVLPALTSLDLHSLVTSSQGLLINTNVVLTTLNLSAYVPTDGTNQDLHQNALNAASVELFLRRCVLAGVTTCTIDLSGGTNAGTASLNAQGQADVVTLGAQLTINP